MVKEPVRICHTLTPKLLIHAITHDEDIESSLYDPGFVIRSFEIRICLVLLLKFWNNNFINNMNECTSSRE